MQYQEQDQETHRWKYIEVWVEVNDSDRLPGILLLVCNSDTSFNIVDPTKNYTKIYSTKSYQDAAFWLQEDEYSKVRGIITDEEYQ